MGNVTTGQRSHSYDRDRTSGWELHGLLVNLRQIGIQWTRHGVLWRNLVHTVGHDTQSIGIQRHVRQQHQHFLVLIHRKILGSSQCHIRNQQTLNRRSLRGIHETNDTIQYPGIVKQIFEIQVVIIRQSHSSQDDTVCLRSQRHVRHHLIVRLIRVGKERDLLTGY